MDLVENEDRNIEVLGNRVVLGEEGQMDGMNTTRQQHGGPDLASDSSGKIEGRCLDLTKVEISICEYSTV